MSLFEGYRLEEDRDGYTVILFLSSQMTEFAEELAHGDSPRSRSLLESVDSYIKENLSDIKVSAVKLMAGALLVATIPFAGGTVSAEALSTAPAAPAIQTPAVQTARYVNYRVTAGDSLWSISRKFNVTINAIKAANNLNTVSLDIGQTLRIPIADGNTAVPLPSTQPEGLTTYKVASGDSLWQIAKRFGTTVDRLRALNRLTTDTVYVGQQLKIPAPAVAAPTVTYRNHTVASGDDIWTLSVRYGIPMTELLKANNLPANPMLQIGQVLRIPVHVIPVKATPGAQYGEYLDWWTEAQYVFPIGSVAKVTDFQTGRSFYVKRTIGANHADCEPLTASDSAVIKSVWGGSYSWATRSVIVEVNGRRIAASMASMPHDIEFIKDNNFTGHFDIHFLNSTRHKDGAVDPYHQTKIRIAAGLQQV